MKRFLLPTLAALLALAVCVADADACRRGGRRAGAGGGGCSSGACASGGCAIACQPGGGCADGSCGWQSGVQFMPAMTWAPPIQQASFAQPSFGAALPANGTAVFALDPATNTLRQIGTLSAAGQLLPLNQPANAPPRTAP